MPDSFPRCPRCGEPFRPVGVRGFAHVCRLQCDGAADDADPVPRMEEPTWVRTRTEEDLGLRKPPRR